MTCETCRHLHRTEPQGGLCRRYPPRAQVITRFNAQFGANTPAWPNESATIWPPVRNEDRCGEWALDTAQLKTDAGAPDREA